MKEKLHQCHREDSSFHPLLYQITIDIIEGGPLATQPRGPFILQEEYLVLTGFNGKIPMTFYSDRDRIPLAVLLFAA